ncbi:MAG: hypothetical protein AB9861_07945 [Methanosarcina sp.]
MNLTTDTMNLTLNAGRDAGKDVGRAPFSEEINHMAGYPEIADPTLIC